MRAVLNFLVSNSYRIANGCGAVNSPILNPRKLSGGKPPFPTCELGPVESNDLAGANCQVRKGGYPRSSLTNFEVRVFT
jgi:hypothetical protein